MLELKPLNEELRREDIGKKVKELENISSDDKRSYKGTFFTSALNQDHSW